MTGPDDTTTRLTTGSALDNLELGPDALPDEQADGDVDELDEDDDVVEADELTHLPWESKEPAPPCPELVAFVEQHLQWAMQGHYQSAVMLFTQMPAGSGSMHAGGPSLFGTLSTLLVEQRRTAECCNSKPMRHNPGRTPGSKHEHADPDVELFKVRPDTLWPYEKMPRTTNNDLVAALAGALQAGQQGALQGLLIFASRRDTDYVIASRGGLVHHRWMLPQIAMEVMRFGSVAFQQQEAMKQQQRMVQPVGPNGMPIPHMSVRRG